MACRPPQERADTRLREQIALAERATKQEKVKETLLEQLRREAEQRRFQVISSVYLLYWYTVQILTPEELLRARRRPHVLSLLALLVQLYKY